MAHCPVLSSSPLGAASAALVPLGLGVWWQVRGRRA
jgi:hypothetical protein